MPTLVADGREFPISSDAWDAWKEAAEPFELPDDVLRRVFAVRKKPVATMKAAAASSPAASVAQANGTARSSRRRETKSSQKRSRIPSHLLLPEGEYELPILEALSATGGRRPTREVVEEVGRVLNGRLTDADREPIHDGGPRRWQNRVQFARLRLVKAGFMKADSPRGVWEISPAGEERVREGKA